MCWAFVLRSRMKHKAILCLLICGLLTLGGCGDDDRFITPETAYIETSRIYFDDSGEPTVRFTAQYDADDNMIRTEFYKTDGEVSGWSDYSYVFLPDGRVSEQREVPDCDTWWNRRVYTDVYDYGADGLPVSETHYKNGEPTSVRLYEYDDHGELLRTLVTQDETQTPQQLGESYVYTYDADGRKTGRQTFTENGELHSETVYEYGESGLLIRERETVPAEPQERAANLNQDAYFADSLTRESEADVYEDVYVYDEQNRLVSRTCTKNGALISVDTREYVQ